jgi:WD40 repeat protein
MARFTEVEERLLKQVTDDRLCSSLEKIREAMEDIWADDAPHIVQDFTDHGVKHSERLVGFAANLLNANDGRPLSSQEMYLLLAGIYLHDIGMQCDIVRYPEIKALAETMGAQFEIEFTAQTASDYTIDEQKIIRRNHQYLTAAWIEHAYRTDQKTTIGTAARTIPENLVADLMDVCEHHAKLPITDCPIMFKFDQTERKQLVAALLRFADELDVDGHRVTIEVVKNFALDPRNAVYWWLHNRTHIVFSARNVIVLTIRLHPDDKERNGLFVHSAFITEFQTKNQPVLTILRQNGIPMTISAESGVAEDDFADPLPLEIVQALQAMQTKHDPLLVLADEVRVWLQAIRYEVGDPQHRDGRTVDMIATLEQGTLRQRVLIRCIDGEIIPADVDALDKVLDRKTPQGWLISDKRVSDLARQRAAGDDAFQVFNLSDFLRQMVWRPYFDALTALVEKDRIPDLYVDLACYKQEMDEEGQEVSQDRHASLDKYIDDWLKERGKMHISLLGEFGTGKTWFCRHYAYRQLGRYLGDPANERLPLLITLRAFTKAMTPQQLINDALLEQYKLPFVGSAFEVFQGMNRRSKLLLILDGFDEMARQVDYQTVVDNFWQLATLVDEGSKVILTSRTEYFRWAKESEKILGGEEYGRRTIVLQPPRFEVLHLEQFSDDQIRQVIIGRLGAENGSAMVDRILEAPNLVDMARKPVLIELLLAALSEVNVEALENPAQVYLYATNKLLLRNIDTRRTFTTTADKFYFLCELAWEMIKSGELRIHYTAIPERIKTYFGDRIKDQHELDTWDFDLRSQTLLHRDAAGYYEFAHKSLAEYFIAFKFAAELDCLAPAFAQTYCEADSQPCTMPIKPKDIAGLAATFGAMALRNEQIQAVRDLMPNVMAEDATKRLWEVIDETRGKPSENVRYTGGNAVTLLRMQDSCLRDARLAEAVLNAADLFNADLAGANLKNAHLREAILSNCNLQNTDLRGADLTGVSLTEEMGINSVAWSPDGSLLACGGDDNNIRIWDIASAVEINTLRGHTRSIWEIAWNSWYDRTILISCSVDGTIRLWDMSGDSPLVKIGFCSSPVYAICLLPSINLLISGEQDGSVKTWEFPSLKPTSSAKGIGDSIQCLVSRPQEDFVASTDDEGAIRFLYPEDTQMPAWRASESFIWCASFNHRGDTLAIGTGYGECSIALWEVSSRALMATIDTCAKGHPHRLLKKGELAPNAIRALAWSTDDQFLFSGSDSGELFVTRFADAKWSSRILGIHEDSIRCLRVSPNGQYLASGGWDATVRIWDIAPDSLTFGQCLKALDMRMNCQGAKVSGARGLGRKTTSGMTRQKEWQGTLLEFFADRGAMLDERQKKIVNEAHRQRKAKEKVAATAELPELADAGRGRKPMAKLRK